MKGRRTFTADEIHQIETLLRRLRRAQRDEQKPVRELLRRRYRFYVSDFGRRLTADDVERLIAQGVIRVRVK
jgi:hypothetical protein